MPRFYPRIPEERNAYFRPGCTKRMKKTLKDVPDETLWEICGEVYSANPELRKCACELASLHHRKGMVRGRKATRSEAVASLHYLPLRGARLIPKRKHRR